VTGAWRSRSQASRQKDSTHSQHHRGFLRLRFLSVAWEGWAKATADELDRRARASAGRAPIGALTVERFFDKTWLPLRQRVRPWQWKADRAAMRTHFLPHFGRHAIADLATDEGEVALLDWLISVRDHPSRRDGTRIASRTVRNVASSVRVFFADAAERKVVRRNPTTGWDADRHLPPIEDKKRGWRSRAGFSLDQVVALTTDHRIPEDRRVLYAMRFLGGPRPGEAANARWRDLDRAKRPLWRLTLETSFNIAMRREKGTKTGAEINIPVHPVLQRILEDWETSGWQKLIGRKPEPTDFIVPRDDGRQRLVSTSYKQFKIDLAAVGLGFQRQYESRATFRNLALSTGVSKFQVDLITHPKPTQGPDYYNRLDMLWSGLCEAVLAIDPAAWDGTPAALPDPWVTTEVTTRVTVEGTTNDKPPTTLAVVGGEMEREKGFELIRWVLANLAKAFRSLQIRPLAQSLE
jgi:integrase